MIDAELYVSACSGHRQMAAQVLDQVWPSLAWPPHQLASLPVLDVGCGAGDVTVLELLPRLPAGARVVAADSSADMLRKAAARFAEPRVDFQLLDIATPRLRESPVWAKGPYSKLFSFFCLHWVPDQRTALSNMCDLLAPGGEAVLLIVTACPLFDEYEKFSRMPQWAAYTQDYKDFVSPYHLLDEPDQTLRALLTEVGFTVKTLTLVKDNAFRFSQQQDMIDTLAALNPFAARMPAEQRATYLRDLVSACYANGTLSGGPGVGTSGEQQYLFNFSIMVVHAVKV